MNLPIQLQAGLYLYLICINMITIAVYGIDKRNAVHGKWRIRVSTLLTLAAVGGSAGALLAMHLFHHKTRKKKFTIGTFQIGRWVQKKTGLTLANPLVIAILLCIGVLLIFDIPYEDFAIGGDIVNMMLGPATAVLALNI